MTQTLEIHINPVEVPPHLRAALQRYVEHRIPTGGFLRAVLENDLLGAVARADSENSAILSKIVKYIYHELPNGCWGSPEKVEAWLKPGPGVAGLTQLLQP